MNPNDPQQSGQQPPVPQKFIDFQQELNELCKKYQYALQPIIVMNPVQGIVPQLNIIEVSPKDEGVQINQDPSAPGAPVNPATPPTPVADPTQAPGTAVPGVPPVPPLDDAAKKNVPVSEPSANPAPNPDPGSLPADPAVDNNTAN